MRQATLMLAAVVGLMSGRGAAQPLADFERVGDVLTSPSGSALRELALVDLDDDGDDDLVTFSRDTPVFPGPDIIEIWERDAGAWILRDSIVLSFSVTYLGTGDANGDGRLDVTIGSFDEAGVLLNTGGFGTLGPFMFPTQGLVLDVELADVTGDGDADLLASTDDDLFTVRRGVGTGLSFIFVNTITSPTDLTTLRDGDLLVDDLNGDGDPDVVTTADNGTNINVFYASGGGNFFGGLFTTVLPVPDNIEDFTIRDMDGDGETDIVAAVGNNGPSQITVYTNDYDGGSESFPNFNDTPPAVIPLNSFGASRVAFFDLSCPRDGLEDLVVSSSSSAMGTRRMAAHSALAAGGFDPDPTNYVSASLSESRFAADLDGDGETDFLSRFSFSNSFPVEIDELLNLCCPADTNQDGTLSPADFNAWIIEFNSGSPIADQNADGVITPADFNAWIANFNAGC